MHYFVSHVGVEIMKQLLLTQGSLGNFLDLFPIAIPGVHSGGELHQSLKVGFGKLRIDANVVCELGAKNIQKQSIQGLSEGPMDVLVVWFCGRIGSLRHGKSRGVAFFGCRCCRL